MTINGAVAPYRRDLRGADLAYELFLMMDKLRPGDTLLIPNSVFYHIGPDHTVTPPPYPHTRWRDDARENLCVRRDK